MQSSIAKLQAHFIQCSSGNARKPVAAQTVRFCDSLADLT